MILNKDIKYSQKNPCRRTTNKRYFGYVGQFVILHIVALDLRTGVCDLYNKIDCSGREKLQVERSFFVMFCLVAYYKSLSDNNLRESDYNWACFE